MNIKEIRKIVTLTCLLIVALANRAQAQVTAFSYQGQLNISNAPANGVFDIQFAVFDKPTSGNAIAGPVTNLAVGVTNGIFFTQLDFGAGAFTGPERWLQIGVRSNGSSEAFSILTPLQAVLAVPYAVMADNASNLLGTVAASQVTGTISGSQLPSGLVSNSSTGLTLSGTFSGNGAGLTNLAAANLSGSIPSASLTSVPAGSLTGTISSSQLPTGVVINGQSGVSLSGTFTGTGSGLTGISASQLSGTLSLSQLPSSILLNNALGVNLSGTFSGFFSGNGSGLNSLNAGTLQGTIPPSSIGAVPASSLTGTIPSTALLGAYPNAVQLPNLANVISGNGGGLTNLSSTSLVGLIPLVNLPPNIFTILTNTLATVTNLTVVGTTAVGDLLVTNSAEFTNASLVLTNTDGQKVVISDGNIILSGVLSGNATGLTNAAGHALVDSTVTNGVGLALLNAGTTLTNFGLGIGLNDTNFAQGIGTTLTNFALGIGANDTNFTKSAGITISNYAQAGSAVLSNYVAAGGTIPKGSLVSNVFLVGPSTNQGPLWVTNGNLTVTNGSVVLTNAGGTGVALNSGNTGNVTFTGTATGNGAGLANVNAATVEGLATNSLWLTGGNSGTSAGANFLGTSDNQALVLKVNGQPALLLTPDGTGHSSPAVVGNSGANSVDSSSYGSFIGDGTANSVLANAFASSIVGGEGNTIQASAYESFIGGGLANVIQSQSSNSFIGSGNLNLIQTSAGFSTIDGGYQNQVQQGAGYSTIGGGYINSVTANAGYSVVGGGQGNMVESPNSVISGGNGNTIGQNATLSAITGGDANTVTTSSDHASIGGGKNNSVTGPNGTVAGGSNNVATTSAFAAGTAAQAINKGAFVWADSSGTGIQSAAADSVTFLANGGYRLYSSASAGVTLAPGATAWGVLSDRNMKKNIAPLDPLSVLKKLAEVPVNQWNYKWETDDSVRHIGPMAQDFKKAFYPGRDDKTITTLEFDGVELAAIKGLNTKVEEQDASLKAQISEQEQQLKSQAAELKEKDAQIDSLKTRLERIEKLIGADNN
jgi:hypothetical protein